MYDSETILSLALEDGRWISSPRSNPFLWLLKKKKKLIFLTVLGLSCSMWAFLVAMSGGYSVGAMHGLLIAVASFVVEHGL